MTSLHAISVISFTCSADRNHILLRGISFLVRSSNHQWMYLDNRQIRKISDNSWSDTSVPKETDKLANAVPISRVTNLRELMPERLSHTARNFCIYSLTDIILFCSVTWSHEHTQWQLKNFIKFHLHTLSDPCTFLHIWLSIYSIEMALTCAHARFCMQVLMSISVSKDSPSECWPD